MYLPLPSSYTLQRPDAPPPPAAPHSKRLCTRPTADATNSALPPVSTLLNTVSAATASDDGRRKGSVSSSGSGKVNRRHNDRRREQCRTNQQRYRNKQKFAVLRLEADVLRLRQAVRWHEFARNVMGVGVDPFSTTAVKVVKEYFAMFRFGLSGASLTLPIRPHIVEELRPGHSAISKANANASVLMPSGADDQVVRSVLPQLAFLKAVFADEVEASGLNGLDAFVELLWRYSCYFSNPRLELEHVQVRPQAETAASHDTAFVLATARLSFAVTPVTMAHVFPNVDEDEWIKSRLLGKRMDAACEVSFEFEKRASQYLVTRTNMKFDLMAVLRTALGRLDVVAAVLERALITPEGVIGDLRGFDLFEEY